MTLLVGSPGTVQAQNAPVFSGSWTVGWSSGIVMNGNQADLVVAMRAADLQSVSPVPGRSSYPISSLSGRSMQFSVGRQVTPEVEIRALVENADGITVTGSNGESTEVFGANTPYLVMTLHSTSVAVMPLGDLTPFLQLGGGPEVAFVGIQQHDGFGDGHETSVSPGLVVHLSARGTIKRILSIHLAIEQHLTSPIGAGPYTVHLANGEFATVVQTTTLHVYHTSITLGGAVRVP